MDAGATTATEVFARAWRSVHWYLRELTGETAYDRYLEAHARRAAPAAHDGCARHEGGGAAGAAAPLSRREFERRRWDRSTTPGSRCC